MRFSQARQVVMVESVIQPILTYAMSSFKIPEALLSEIKSMAVTFFEHKDGGTKIHWVVWKNVCRGRQDGELEIRSLKEFNLALLCK
ncbi:UNVERIFIED_CONTAM: hypothetical protein Sangu_1403100 [Sesamum angustifolium]|uniref:Uncharacterized protein n=1 Tax=Sesamum angustifolium TaxID=2727405 RepID=A0AAW2N5P6_9LAMI